MYYDELEKKLKPSCSLMMHITHTVIKDKNRIVNLCILMIL